MIKQKRNLLILAYDYPPATGGIARLCYEITLGLANYYNTVKVFTSDFGDISKYYRPSNVEIRQFSTKRIQCELETVKAIKKIKNKASYDLLCGVWHPEGLLAILGGIKNIYILGHGTEFLSGTSMIRKWLWLPLYAKFVLKRAKNVINNSHYTENLVKNISPRIKTVALPLAVNHNTFKPNTIRKTDNTIIRLVTVSRILKFKGHDFILKVLEQLPLSLQSKIEWHIAGTGPDMDYLKALISTSSLANQIHLHGFVSDKDLPSFYNTKDIFILATRETKLSTQVEGFGLVFLEAQSCGLPVIGTKTGGIADAVDSGNGGWLVAQDDEAELLELLTFLLKSPEVIKEHAIKARKRVENEYTWIKYCSKLYNIISA